MSSYKTSAAFLLLCIFFFSSNLKSQSAGKGFRSLSRPEKCWVIAHPFIAKKAFRCSMQARAVSDSLGKTGTISGANGGQLDAFRHAYWMALLSQKIAVRKAVKLGNAHEKGNYLDWEKRKSEDGSRADSIMCVMDLKNNASGIAIGVQYKSDTAAAKTNLAEQVLKSVWNGELTIIKKDAEGNPLTCEGQMIDPTMYDDKWYIPKCLVKSNEIVVKH